MADSENGTVHQGLPQRVKTGHEEGTEVFSSGEETSVPNFCFPISVQDIGNKRLA